MPTTMRAFTVNQFTYFIGGPVAIVLTPEAGMMGLNSAPQWSGKYHKMAAQSLRDIADAIEGYDPNNPPRPISDKELNKYAGLNGEDGVIDFETIYRFLDERTN